MTSTHLASVAWKRTTPDFDYETYGRDHTIRFGSGSTIEASSAPEYKGDASRVNPEESLVAALSSCHMLTFLAVAARAKLVVDAYDDDAVGYLEKNAEGRIAVTRVTLRPRIRFAGDVVIDAERLAKLHEQAHRACFVANSVKTVLTVESRE
ncbi:MAG: OsmC family protein [Deltaproteobacteria bacterium]